MLVSVGLPTHRVDKAEEFVVFTPARPMMTARARFGAEVLSELEP